MKRGISLGQSESATLEFKGADALRRPFSLARSVVAMLNGEGGKIWIGIKAKAGRAVMLESVLEAEPAAQSLRDRLCDSIDPTPGGRECEVEIIEAAPGVELLCISVRPVAEKRPYAAGKRGGLFFYARTGERIRSLSRDEALALAFQSRRRPSRLAGARERIGHERAALLKKKQPLLWIRILPVGAVALDLSGRRKEIAALLREPALTDNRDAGWNFAMATGAPALKKGRITHGAASGLRITLDEAGGIEVRAPLDMLYWQGGAHAIWPFALLELPASVFRLARALYRLAGAPDSLTVFADLAMFEARGWTLQPNSPRSIGYSTTPGRFSDDELVWDRPLSFSIREVIEAPDRCAFRLVRRVYESFGFDERQMPAVLDAKSGRLVLPR